MNTVVSVLLLIVSGSFYASSDRAIALYILEHLKRKTGINFIPYNMDIYTLEKNKDHWINLTENDKNRLSLIADKTNDYKEIIDYMLKNNCKLEQESEIM